MADNDVPFPANITPPASGSSLVRAGNGVTGHVVETIEVKLTEMAVYVDPNIGKHMQAWKAQTAATGETVADDDYTESFVEAPVQKLVWVRILKGIRGTVYAGGVESSVRDRLAYDDKYEEDEEAALEKSITYIGETKVSSGSGIFFHWPSPSVVQVTVSEDGSVPKEVGHSCDNENVSKFLLRYMIGESSVSESTALSTAKGVAALC